MLKLRWPRRTKTSETDGHAPGDTAGSDKDASMPGGATRAQDEVPAAESLRDSLEVLKTAIVWLVVINILTVLSPLLWLPLKWTLAVGVLLTGASVAVGCVAYLRARGTQRHFPE
jgi:CHASE2 domain-containing sensor protein